MASRRLIASEMFEDDFYLGLDLLGRNLWIGLIVRCADDQGRLQDNPVLIKSQVFPADNITPEQIDAVLQHFAAAERVLRYTDGKKRLIQILNWWKHQSPSWAAASIYSAPEGWTDRVKVHGKGTQVTTLNWDTKGGYCTPDPIPNPLPNGLPNDLDRALNDGDVKDKSSSSAPPPRASEPANDADYAALVRAYDENIIGGISPILKDILYDDLSTYGLADCMDAIQEAVRNGARKWSYVQAILKRWKEQGRVSNKHNGNGQKRGKRSLLEGKF